MVATLLGAPGVATVVALGCASRLMVAPHFGQTHSGVSAIALSA
jgi:hypothetical protein